MADANAIYNRVTSKSTFCEKAVSATRDAILIATSILLGCCVIAEALRNSMDEAEPTKCDENFKKI